MKHLIIFTYFTFIAFSLQAQKYAIDARISNQEILEGHLKMGNPGPVGREIIVNSKYLTLDGKPILPVMGEIHYSRVPREKWEDLILKMKANGINIIACYVFWIHHEEIEGKFDWSGNKDLRAFIQLCQKHGLWAYPRIGPWCHGEVRNGGLPDWLLKKSEVKARSNDTNYQQYVEKLYSEIGNQLSGLMYKDGGPVIGIQLENEYWRGKSGEAHILWLKQTAIKYGMDVPLYTVTGWNYASVPPDEVIPLWGGYPAAPWNTNLKKITENDSYVFEKPINDESIGHKETSEKYSPDYSRYPYLTCELGVGNQISEHRRPVIDPLDGLAIATSKTGSGSNLPGYYVFAGGLNPVGRLTTLEEDKLESGYWNEYPDISYDFQAAIRETGEIAPSYHKVKILHYFLNEFGDRLAPMNPIVPDSVDSKTDLQYAVRASNNSGFVFGMNYYRGYAKPVQKDVQFHIQLEKEELVFPSKPLDIADSTVFIWPFNFDMDGITLKYATAQPLCKIENEKSTDWFFLQTKGIMPEFSFKSENIESISLNDKKPGSINGQIVIDKFSPELNLPVIIRNKKGKSSRIFVIPAELADQMWLLRNQNKKYLFLSSSNLYLDSASTLHAFGTSNIIEITPLSPVKSLKSDDKKLMVKNTGNFSGYKCSLPSRSVPFELSEKKLFDDAGWLMISSDNYKSKNELFQRLFFKEFNLENTAEIRKSILKIFTDTPCKVRVNGVWVNQTIESETMNNIDLTGYLQIGLNKLLLDMPYSGGEKVFAAEVETEFYNSDKVYITSDSSWLTIEQYKIPANWETTKNLVVPVLVSPSVNYSELNQEANKWVIKFPAIDFKQYNNAFLRIDYAGNKAQCRKDSRLIADNFNNATTWSINLSNCSLQSGEELQFEFEPLNEGYKIYFDKNPLPEDLRKTIIKSVRIEPEYTVEFKVMVE